MVPDSFQTNLFQRYNVRVLGFLEKPNKDQNILMFLHRIMFWHFLEYRTLSHGIVENRRVSSVRYNFPDEFYQGIFSKLN